MIAIFLTVLLMGCDGQPEPVVTVDTGVHAVAEAGADETPAARLEE